MKNLITWFLNQAMLQEALQQAGAAQYEQTDARKAHRKDYKDRSLKTRYGETMLRKPQFREFPFETQVFGRYARVEKALVNAVVESYLQGVSTRKVQEIIAHLGIDHLSPASVSRMAKDLDDPFWLGLFEDLKERGLAGVQLVISDGHTGIQKAASAAFLGASWQMCSVHECPGIPESRQHHRAIPPRAYELHGIPKTALEETQDDKPDGAGQ